MLIGTSRSTGVTYNDPPLDDEVLRMTVNPGTRTLNISSEVERLVGLLTEDRAMREKHYQASKKALEAERLTWVRYEQLLASG